MSAQQGLGRGPLQERAGLRVDRPPDEVVLRRVADVQLDRRIEGRQLDEIGGAMRAGLDGRGVLRECRSARHEEYQGHRSKRVEHDGPPEETRS
jgi:hypothetical protein